MNKVMLTATSTLAVHIMESGHVFERQVPCTVVGYYLPSNGHVSVATVIADGRNYDMLEIDADEWNKFHELLRQTALLWADTDF